MPETPIRTDTGEHPFDEFELSMIRAVCAAGALTVDYAAAVMPAMADKIEQLRALLDEAAP